VRWKASHAHHGLPTATAIVTGIAAGSQTGHGSGTRIGVCHSGTVTAAVPTWSTLQAVAMQSSSMLRVITEPSVQSESQYCNGNQYPC
jgi:hypothetical protein